MWFTDSAVCSDPETDHDDHLEVKNIKEWCEIVDRWFISYYSRIHDTSHTAGKNNKEKNKAFVQHWIVYTINV